MQRQRGGLVPISEALDDLPGPDQAVHPAPKARRASISSPSGTCLD